MKSHKDRVVIVPHELISRIHRLVLTTHLEDELDCICNRGLNSWPSRLSFYLFIINKKFLFSREGGHERQRKGRKEKVNIYKCVWTTWTRGLKQVNGPFLVSPVPVLVGEVVHRYRL